MCKWITKQQPAMRKAESKKYYNTGNLKDDSFELLEDVIFEDIDKNLHIAKAGFLTDGYSKPWITFPFVRGKFSDDLRPAILHDSDCYWAIYNKENGFPYESFDQVNDRFYRSMRATKKIPLWKCWLMRKAVNANPDRW